MNNAPDEELQREWAAKLANGEITLAEYVGLSKKELYVIANQAYQLLQSGRLEEARDIYKGLVAADPYDSVFHCHLGAAQLRLGDEDEALKQFDLALQYNIANIDALAARGEIYLNRGKINEAVADLGKAIELDAEGKRASTVRARAALTSLREQLTANREQQTANSKH